MDPVESMHFEHAIPPGVIKDNTAFVSRVIDTVVAGGGRNLVFVVGVGSIDAALAELKVKQSEVKTNDTTLGGTVTDLLDAASVITLPGATDDDKIVIVEIDMSQLHGRYMQLSAIAGDGVAGTYLSAVAFFTFVGVPETNLGALAVARG